MPHLTYEYTENISAQADIGTLLAQSNQVIIDQGGVFPVGGIRSRAYCLREYCVADGSHADDAFVHAHLKIGAGRTESQKQKVGDELFALMTAHFASVASERGLALSLEISEFSESGTWKKNNIHARYK
jgi:5-carboxymethyl-2-hydroxymuconate isomerase